MRNPEYIIHGSTSQKDSKNIESEGLKATEGRATVSGDLVYAFDWATSHERKKFSQSTTEVEPEEVGKIIIFKVPEGYRIDYGVHTEINLDDETKEITKYPKKYTSGRRQLGIYSRIEKLENTDKAKVQLPPESIALSIKPTLRLKEELDSLLRDIRGFKTLNVDEISNKLSSIITEEKDNKITPGININEVIKSLIITTIQTEIINLIRNWSMDVKIAQGYKVYNREERIPLDKQIDQEKLKSKLAQVQSIVNAADFNIGLDSLNRYIRSNVGRLIKELEKA